MTQEQLNNLFQHARAEKVETSVTEVYKWIGYSSFTALILGLISKLKIFTFKTGIMYLSLLSAIALTFTFIWSSTDEMKPTSIKIKEKTIEPQSQEREFILLRQSKAEDLTEDRDIIPFTSSELAEITPIFPLELVPSLDREPITPIEVQKILAVSSENKQLKPFSDVYISGHFRVVLIEGNEHSYRAEGNFKEENLLIAWDTNGEKGLYIAYDPTGFKKNKKRKNQTSTSTITFNNKPVDLTIYLTFKSIERLKLSGVITATTQTPLNGTNMELKIGGASNFEGSLNYTKLVATTSGTASAKLNANVQQLVAKANGASKLVFGTKMMLGTTTITTNGTSHLALQANMESLTMEINGASTVSMVGESKTTNLTINGSSDFKSENFHSQQIVAEMHGSSDSKFSAGGNSSIQIYGTSTVQLKANMTALQTSITGGAHLKIEGSIEELNAEMSGTAKLDASRTTIQDAQANMSGASAAKLNVAKKLRISASGSSTVTLLATPTEIQESLSGSAKINKK